MLYLITIHKKKTLRRIENNVFTSTGHKMVTDAKKEVTVLTVTPCYHWRRQPDSNW